MNQNLTNTKFIILLKTIIVEAAVGGKDQAAMIIQATSWSRPWMRQIKTWIDGHNSKSSSHWPTKNIFLLRHDRETKD